VGSVNSNLTPSRLNPYFLPEIVFFQRPWYQELRVCVRVDLNIQEISMSLVLFSGDPIHNTASGKVPLFSTCSSLWQVISGGTCRARNVHMCRNKSCDMYSQDTVRQTIRIEMLRHNNKLGSLLCSKF